MGALSGIRVVEVGQYVTGPEAGVLLADLGADVIKIESPARGDPFRQWGHGGYSATFCSLNRNKRSVALNVSKPEGTDVLLRLIDTADVVIENFRPGQTSRWGWGYDVVAARNPRIVYCEISGFGSVGPYRDRPGYDTVGVAMGGLLSVLTDMGAPLPMGISLADHLTGIYAMYGILGALLARERTGRGQLVETSLLQSTIAFMSENIATYFESGEIPSQQLRARRAGVWAFVAGDHKPFVIHLSSPVKFWENMVKVAGHPELIDDPLYADGPARRRNYDALKATLDAAFAEKSRAEWLDELIAADVPCAPINTLEDVFADPQVEALGMRRTVTHPVQGEVTLAAPGVALSDTPLLTERAPPLLAEQTREVLAELGLTDAEMAALAQGGFTRLDPPDSAEFEQTN